MLLSNLKNTRYILVNYYRFSFFSFLFFGRQTLGNSPVKPNHPKQVQIVHHLLTTAISDLLNFFKPLVAITNLFIKLLDSRIIVKSKDNIKLLKLPHTS